MVQFLDFSIVNHQKWSLIIDQDEFKITLIALNVIGLPNIAQKGH